MRMDDRARILVRSFIRRVFMGLGLAVIVLTSASCRFGEAVTDGVYGGVADTISTAILNFLLGAAGATQ